jgi:hypothetical protein
MSQSQTLMLFVVPAVLIVAAVVWYLVDSRRKKTVK